jgi:hypothetical protein
VWVLCASVNLKITELCTAKRTARKHSLDCELDHVLRVPITKLSRGRALKATDIAGVAVVHLVVPLLTSERDFVSVDDDHVIAVIDVRGEGRLVLATEDMSDLRCRTTEDLSLKVDDPPLAILNRFSDWSRACTHGKPLK